jgi:hypothetical protein
VTGGGADTRYSITKTGSPSGACESLGDGEVSLLEPLTPDNDNELARDKFASPSNLRRVIARDHSRPAICSTKQDESTLRGEGALELNHFLSQRNRKARSKGGYLLWYLSTIRVL